jgi:PAS domain S-box-containing protein
MRASLQGHAAAIGAVALAFGVRALLDPILADNVPFVTFFAAAAVAAWYGGVGPGILAATLGFLAAHHAFMSPGSDLATRRVAELVAGVAYFATSGTIVALCAALRRSIQRSQGSALQALASERERDRTAEALSQAEARLAAIVESSDDAIIGKTLEGIVTSWNGGAQRIFGYTMQEMIGQPIFRLAPPDRPDEMRAVLEQIRRGKRVEHFETERIRKDGERIHVSLTVSPIMDSTGRIVGASKVARDVSDRKRSEQERELLLENAERARAEAEAASRAKDAFLATVSHELRTPLSPILAWSTMLRQGALDASKTERALETIERCARNQAQLVEDLLDVSRIVAGKLRLGVRPVDVEPVVRAAIDVVRPAAEAKEIRLEVVLDPDSGRVSGDPERLQQVVWNLLSNAVKFTPRGGRVRAVLERVGSHLEIAVSDSGQGIARDFLPYVFERFRQADGTTTRAHGGLGLGLAIVRHIVELHGGSVHAESPGEGGGAVFTVRLPLLPRARAAGEGERLHPVAVEAACDLQRPSLEGLRILVVDDDPDSNEVLRMLLSSCRAEIEVAGSVAQAIDALRRFDAHLLVSDIGMPVQDGYALIRKVREGDTQRSMPLPAIALTAYGSVEDRVRLLSAGFQAHLTKPVDAAELLALVASLARSPGPD